MYEIGIALRHFSAHNRLTFLFVFTVALAMAVIIVLMSLMSGFTDELISMTVKSSPQDHCQFIRQEE